jgi:Na+(H+)/acetate symporter ActP
MDTTVPVDCAVLAPFAGVKVEFMDPAVPILPAVKVAGFAKELAGQRELVEWTQAEDVLKGLGVQSLGTPWHTLNQPDARPRPIRSNRLGGLKRWQLIFLAAMAVADLLVLIGGLVIVLQY